MRAAGRIGWRLRLAVGLVLIVGGALALALGLFREALLDAAAARWPLSLAVPEQWWLDDRLQRLGRNSEQCDLVLKPPEIRAARVADKREGDACGWTNAYAVPAVSGARLAVGAMTCELATAFALWMEHEVQPAALATFGARISEIRHLGSYACRNIQGTPRFAHVKSQHARANAIDVRGFRTANGRDIDVRTHWQGDSAESSFLRGIHARSCRYFHVAIGPGYNAAHRDHLHLDRGPYRACR